jgi:C4-dicarboxylate-specific signal transduction histidine kinase
MPHFRDVAEWLPEAMLLLAADGRMHAANHAARSLLAPAGASLPASLPDCVTDEPASVTRYLRDALRTRQPIPGRFRLHHGVGAPFEVRTSAHRVATLGGVIGGHGHAPADPAAAEPGVILHLTPTAQEPSQFRLLTARIEALGHEIQRRKAAEEERRKLEARMLQAQKLESLGVLAGGIAHDFNNLLTSVIGDCDLAPLELPPDSPAQPLVEEAVHGARRAAELTQQMLAYSGKARFTVGPLQLSQLVTEVTRLLEVSISK